MFDMKKMMEQAQQVQFKLQELQEKFKEIFVEGEAGGGMVKVTMSCAGVVKSIAIDETLMTDKETLEDLVTAAVNKANDAKEARVQKESQSMMAQSGLNPDALGGGGGMPF